MANVNIVISRQDYALAGETAGIQMNGWEANTCGSTALKSLTGVTAVTSSDTGILLISYSEFYEKTWLLIQNQLEENCYTNKGNPAGSIFGLKAQFDWREDESPQHLVQNLVIADSEQAEKAMKMLGYVGK